MLLGVANGSNKFSELRAFLNWLFLASVGDSSISSRLLVFANNLRPDRLLPSAPDNDDRSCRRSIFIGIVRQSLAAGINLGDVRLGIVKKKLKLNVKLQSVGRKHVP